MATMGSIYSSANTAELAIDGELSTFQHTRCSAGQDWWQLELPRSARVTHIDSERGAPLLYLQSDGDQTLMGKAMMSHFGLSTHDNYWAEERLTVWTPDAENAVPSCSEQIADAVDSINEGRITCKPDLIANGFGGTLQTSIVDALNAMRASFAALDAGAFWRAASRGH